MAADMKFGWKPQVEFKSAPIPLYFNFCEHPMYTYYREQASYDGSFDGNAPKIIYYGFRPRDSFEMHRNFVKPQENSYEFEFPKFYGLEGANAFYDSFFEDLLEGEQPQKEEQREFIGMSPDLPRSELQFNSNFESGNLDMVVKAAPLTYDLFLRVDTNTKGHFNWFYFQMSNTRKGQTIRLNIVNMTKGHSLYQQGMQINYWSRLKNQPLFTGWLRGGQNIQYQRSRILKEAASGRDRRYMTLSFDFTFEFDNDHVYFAYTIPYTFSMLV